MKYRNTSDITLCVRISAFYPVALDMLLTTAMAVKDGETVARYELSKQAYFFALSDLAHLVKLLNDIESVLSKPASLVLDFDAGHLYNGNYHLVT